MGYGQGQDDGQGGAPDGDVASPGVWPVFANPQLMLFLRHWAERRPVMSGGSGLVMPRTAIDPSVLRACLPDVWLFQYHATDDRFVCTLAGERVNEAWGQSLIGKTPQQFMSAESGIIAQEIYRRIVLTPALHVSHRRITPAGRREKGAERLVVPLSDDQGRPYGIFGLSHYHFDPVTEADHEPYVGSNVTYFPCAALPLTLP